MSEVTHLIKMPYKLTQCIKFLDYEIIKSSWEVVIPYMAFVERMEMYLKKFSFFSFRAFSDSAHPESRLISCLLIFLFVMTGCTPKVNTTRAEQLRAALTTDKIAPSILLFDAPPIVVAGGSVVKIPIQATDNKSVESYKLQYSEDSTQFSDVSEASASDTTITWNVPKVDRSNVILKLIAVDSSKNESSVVSKAFAIDSTPPSTPSATLTSSNPTPISDATFTIASCTDAPSLYMSETSTAPAASDSGWKSCSTSESATTFTLSSNEGVKTVYFWAKDLAGNISDSSSVQITLNLSAPIVTSVSVQTGLTVDVTFNLPMSTGVTTATNYTLSGTGKGSLATHPTSVALVSGNTYRLTWASGKMFNGGNISIAVANAINQANIVINSSSTHTGGAIAAVPSAPSALALVTPATSPGNNTTPVIRVSGVASSDTISLYTASTCTGPSLRASGTASGATIDLTSSALTQATYTFYANAVDEGGNTSPCSTANVSYVLDTGVPTLAISTPAASAYVNNAGKAAVTVSGSCSENGRTVSVSATDSGSTSVSATPTCNTGSTPNWTTSLNFTTLTDGAITLAASHSDTAGNSTNASNVSINLDATLPSTSLTSPTGPYAGAASLTLNFSASDAGSGLSNLKVQYASDGTTFGDVATVANNATSYSWTIPSDNVATAKVRILATDTAGNTNSSTSSAFTIDSSDPTISLTSFNGSLSVYKGTSQTITWTASDTNFGATPIAIDYSPNGGTSWTNITTGVANTGSYSWTIPSISTTQNAKLRLTATDTAGKTASTESTAPFKISGAPASINVTGSSSITAGTCNSYTFSIRDSGNGAAYVSSALTVDIASGGWGTLYSNPTCTTTATTRTVPNTASGNQIYYKSNLVNASVTLTVSESTIPLTDGTISVAVVPAAASQLSFTTQPSTTATAGTNFATQPVVTLKDAFGNTITATTPSVDLTAFTDSSCRNFANGTLTASSTAPSSGVSTFSGVQYSQGDTIYLKASAVGTTPACSNAITVSGTPTKLAITGTNSVSSSQCSAPLTVTALDSNNNPANVASNQTISLSSSLSGTFYSDANCSSSITTVQISSGTSSATFYFKDATQESPTLTASVGGLTDGTFVIKIRDITYLTAGSNRVCAIVGGAAYCWGDNGYGALGNNVAGSPNSYVPTQVLGLTSGVTKMTTDSNTTCAIVSGAAYCWGLNSSGQLGDNTNTAKAIPTQVFGLTSGVTDISIGGTTTCAIVSGAVQCWGSNSNGQLGNNTSGGTSYLPVQVSGLTSGATSVAVVGTSACAVVNGGVQCWGSGTNGTLGNGSLTPSLIPVQVSGLTSGVTSLASAGGSTCALLSTGSVQCWGGGAYGVLGYNGTTARTTPSQVTGLTSGVTVLSGGGTNYCAIQSGAVYCWGSNTNGQIGNGSYNSSVNGVGIPYQVSGLSSGATLVASGNQSCAVVNGKLQCWGGNGSGNLGNNTLLDSNKIPLAVSGITTATTISSASTGNLFSAILSDTSMIAWGENTYNGIGTGSNSPYRLLTEPNGMSSGITAISSGNFNNSCAVVSGSLKCWGYNASGQVGNGVFGGNQSTPAQVTGLTSGVTQVALGGNSTCAIVSGGVQCWGANGQGQLGDGSNTLSNTPIQVSGLTSGATQISAGNSHACALVSGGVQCWGNGTNGRLGNNGTSDSLVPSQVYGLTSGVTQISAGYRHACAVVNGSAQCWGAGSTGAIGNNATSTNVLIPTQVYGLTSGVTQLASGNDSTCALVNGGVKCWGTNGSGQLGNNSTTQSNIPVQVKYLTSGVASIGATSTGYCAVMDNGSIYCWGKNDYAQMGYNPFMSTPTFVGPWP